MRNPTGINRVREQSVDVSARKWFPAALGAIRRCAALRPQPEPVGLVAGVSWPMAEDLDDVQLEALLFPPPPTIAVDQRLMPDWGWVHRELRQALTRSADARTPCSSGFRRGAEYQKSSSPVRRPNIGEATPR
jgi:hypothetical protein